MRNGLYALLISAGSPQRRSDNASGFLWGVILNGAHSCAAGAWRRPSRFFLPMPFGGSPRSCVPRFGPMAGEAMIEMVMAVGRKLDRFALCDGACLPCCPFDGCD